ncbi:uncharacterized protein [Antedon mediterranea]|uniref:uncharacterized protein n=1 Tax=Antedon mediterranea TaxID=105859 RepID=UPI003AF84F5B
MHLVGLLLLVCALSQSAQALHYRGGTFYWEKINNRKITRGGKCLFLFSYETDGPCTWSSWLYLQNFSSGRCWNLLSHVDLSIENNSPRVTAGLPLYRVRQGCELLIDLKASDPDGDTVRCRWADPVKQECPDDANEPRVCGDPSKDPAKAEIYEDRCLVRFQAEGDYVIPVEGHYYGVSVMVEDFDEGSTKPKSTVPYQFLIQVTEPGSCIGPEVSLGNPCSSIKPGTQWESTISAKLPEESDGNRVEEMTYILPKGMTYTEDIPPPGRFVQSTLSFQTTKLGIYEYTITATDDFGLQGKSVSGKIEVTDDETVIKPPPHPQVLNDESYPASNSQLDETREYWFIQFDGPVSRPEKSAYITVLDNRFRKTYATYDSANPDEVEFPADNPTIARYKAPKNLQPGQTYALQIEEGLSVVKYSTFCELAAVVNSDTSAYPFSIPTPPEPTVECDQSEITASVPKSYANDKSVNKLHLIDPRCKSNDNGTHLIIKFAYDSCGTYIKKKSSDITRFINILRDDPEPYQTSKLITREKRKVNIKIICEVEGVGIANVYFNPDTSVESSKFLSKTRLESMLELYEDNGYNDKVEYGTEKEVDFKDTLYFAARAHDSGKEVAIESCRATPKYKSCTKFDKKFEFIKDGCPVDDTVMFYGSGSFAQRRFSIKTFAMINYGLDDAVWVTCSFVTCDPTNNQSYCRILNSQESCNSAAIRRRKRSATDAVTQAFLEVQIDSDFME